MSGEQWAASDEQWAVSDEWLFVSNEEKKMVIGPLVSYNRGLK